MRLSSRMSEESHYRSHDDRLSDFGDDVFSRSQDDPEGGGSNTHQLDRRKQRNYRLIIDPLLKQGPTKVYRYDGHIPGDSTPIVVRDPRSRMARYGTRRDVNLPVPAFKFDEHYVGTVLPKEVTFCNLNNNISESFLRDMCKNFGGIIEEATVYYHPRTRRHLGIGTVLFSSTRAARLCADKLHLTSKMGNIMTVYVDNLGQQRRKLVEEASADKPVVRPPSPKSHLQPEPYRQPALPDTHHPPLPVEIHRVPSLSETPRPRQSSESQRGSSWSRSQGANHLEFQRSHSSVSLDTMGTDKSEFSPNDSLSSSHEGLFQHIPNVPHVHSDFSFSSPLPPPPLPRDLGLSFPPIQMDLTLPPPPLPGDRGGFNSGRLLPPPPHPGQGYRAPPVCDGPAHFDATTECSTEDNTRKSSHNHHSDQTSSSEAYSIGRACREAAAAAALSNTRENDDVRRSINRHNGRYSRDNSRSSSRHNEIQSRDDSRGSSYQDSSRDSSRNRDNGRNFGRDNRRGGMCDESASHDEEKVTRNFDNSRSGSSRDSHRDDRRGYSRHDDNERHGSRRHEENQSSRKHESVRDSGSHRRNHRDYENKHAKRQRSDRSDVSEPRHFHDDNSNPEHSHSFPDDWRHDSVSRDGVSDQLISESNACVSVLHDDGSSIDDIASSDNNTITVPPPAVAPLSLELRIEALLAQSAVVPFLSPSGSESPPKVNELAPTLPPLPVDSNVWQPPQPPSAGDGFPPLPADHVLPPPPPSDSGDSGVFSAPWGRQQPFVGGDDIVSTPSEKCTTETQYAMEITDGDNAMRIAADEDDDRMSLSSLSSGEEKLEVVERNNIVVNNEINHQPSQLFMNHAQNYINNKLSTQTGPSMMWPAIQSDISSNGKDMCRPSVAQDTKELSRFESVLEKVICELRVVLCRDMQKKMIENTGFKSLEKWFQEKNTFKKPSIGNSQPPVQLSDQSKRIQSAMSSIPTVSSSVSLASTTTSSSSLKPPPAMSDISSMSLSSLFDRHDSGPFGLGFGSGGLLGLRGAMPKMPSFRKKCQSPVQLPDDVEHEDEEQEEESEQDENEADAEQDIGESDEEDDFNEAEFKGPRTPQDSFEDEDNEPKAEDSSADSDSMESEDGEFIPNIRPSKKVIYSSESEEDSIKSDFEDEPMEEEGDTQQHVPTPEDKSLADDEEEDITKDESGEDEESCDEEDVTKDESEEDEEADVDVEAEESEKMSVVSDLENKRLKLNEPDEHQALHELEDREEDEKKEPAEERVEERKVKLIERDKDEDMVKITEKEEDNWKEKESKLKVVERKDSEHPVKVKEEHKVKFTVSEDEEGECSDDDDDDDRATVTASEEEDGYDKMVDVSSSLASFDDVTSKKVPLSTNEDSSSTVSAEESSDKSSLIERRRDKRRTSAELGRRSPTLCLKRLVIPSSPPVDTESSAAAQDSGHKQSPADLEHNYFALPQVTKRGHQDSFIDSTRHSIAETNSVVHDQITVEQLKPALRMTQVVSLDHCYCKAPSSEEALEEEETQNAVLSPVKTVNDTVKSPKTSRAHKIKRGGLSDVTNVTINRELSSILTPVVPPSRPRFERRDYGAELVTLFKFLITGADAEDIAFLRQRYEQLLQLDSVETDWVNEIHWVDHPVTSLDDPSLGPPPRKRRKHGSSNDEVTQHLTGCARTEGYYKISHQEKCNYLSYTQGVQNSDQAGGHGGSKGAGEQLTEADAASQTKKKVQQSREARSESRRWQSVLSSLGEDYGDLLKFNQLKFRKKQLKFARSGIHDWGLFAQEQIAEGEMVIEYVGQVVRQSVADLREKRYEAVGIGSSYLFRVDGEAIVDATRYGNLARFINHSCNPNCYAKIVTVESQKKIVIYSRREINMNEEITYDYKFPIEDNKIPCFCGAPGCRGSLN